MEKLNNVEMAFLIATLKGDRRKAEIFLEEHGDSFEAYFVKNETIPFLESIIQKLEA